MSRVVVNPTFRQEMGQPENSREWQRVAGAEGLRAISSFAPVRFGTLRDTLFVRVDTGSDGQVRIVYGTTRAYGKWQEMGTGIYGPLKRRITPKRAKFLSWVDTSQSPGQPGGPGALGPRFFAKSVKGSKPTLFMYRGLVDVFGAAQSESYAAEGGRPGGS